MSGGYFDYQQWHLEDIAESIKTVILNNESKELDEWGHEKGHHLPPDIIEHCKKAEALLRTAFIYVQRIDWLLSGDDGEESFRKRLKQELATDLIEVREAEQ